jgi:ATP-binding protein involved in chromosome partitioning
MSSPEATIRSEIEALLYPKLDRTLGSLEVVQSVTLNDRRLDVVLAMHNEEAFSAIEAQLRDRYSKEYALSVRPKAAKSIQHGTTQNPNNRAPYAKKIIAVSSGKGGVGKTTLSVNLAVALAQSGAKVGLLDADVYGPDVPRMLGMRQERLRWNDNDQMIPAENFGVKVMSVGLTTPTEDTPLAWRASVATSALIQFLEDVAWGALDFLVIDMPPGTGDVQLTMAQELPITAAILVTTPQKASVDDVSRAVRMFEETRVPVAGVVENMSYLEIDGVRHYPFGQGGGIEIAGRYGLELLAQIPAQEAIREGSDGGFPVAAGEEAGAPYRQLAEKIAKA